MSQSSDHLQLLSGHWYSMASQVAIAGSNRAPLGCGGRRVSLHSCAADKSEATVWCYQVDMIPKSLRNGSNTDEVRMTSGQRSRLQKFHTPIKFKLCLEEICRCTLRRKRSASLLYCNSTLDDLCRSVLLSLVTQTHWEDLLLFYWTGKSPIQLVSSSQSINRYKYSACWLVNICTAVFDNDKCLPGLIHV